MTDNLLTRLFGPSLWETCDDPAIRNGYVLPFLEEANDIGHRITTPAWTALVKYHQPSHPEYTEREYHHWFYQELLPLVDVAHLAWENRKLLGILQTDYEFQLTNTTAGNRLQYVPNARGGITIQLPSDIAIQFLSQ